MLAPPLARWFPIKPVRCPSCRLRIDGQHVWNRRSCPACGAVFRVRPFYFLSLYAIALVVSAGIAFLMGNRDEALVSLAFLLLLPTFFVMAAVNVRLFPIDIAMVSPGWSPGDSEADQEIEQEFERLRTLDPVVGWVEHEPSTGGESDTTPGPLPLSTPRDPPLTLEGIAIAIALSALLAYHIYAALEPHLR